MNRRISWTGISLATAALLFLGQSVNAQCDSGGCAPTSTAYPVDGCASGNCGGVGFGYPGTGGASHFLGGHRHNGPFKQHVHHLKEIHRRDFARNQAWPMPFNCADRQIYHEIWNPMIERGIRWNCVFTSQHFDPETNQLNSAGKAKVRGIFRNSTLDQKMALVQDSGDSAVVRMRLASLRTVIDKWYGTDTFTEIAQAPEFPGGFAGSRAQSINFQYIEQTPSPTIPVATGTGSTSDVGVGN